MTDGDQITRRTVLETGTALAVPGVGTTTAAVAGPRAEHAARDDTTPQDQTGETACEDGFYSGTIDRIVDGEHVVVLLESGGETVDQVILDRARVPDAAEGDSALVWLRDGEVVVVWAW